MDVIREYHPEHPYCCSKCGQNIFTQAKEKIKEERKSCRGEIQSNISLIPMVSTHSPLKWDYDVVDLVTGQSTTGTGVLSEFTSSFTDLFGVQSGMHNKKLKQGENLCKTQLRIASLNMGCNGIIAIDIDYAELGSIKGMIMVCMSGTAVRIKNFNVLGEKRGKKIEQLHKINQRLIHLDKYNLEMFVN